MERWDARIPGGEVLAARHFQGHRQPDVYEGYRAKWEPCMEIMQSRGEQREWIETFLREGAKLGFLGATDHSRHWHFAYCMTGVWATAPARDAIFEAIWQRRTIAGSAKILLHTDVSGVPMGGEGEIEGDAKLRVVAESALHLRQIEVFRDGERGAPGGGGYAHAGLDVDRPRQSSQPELLLRAGGRPAKPAAVDAGGGLRLARVGDEEAALGRVAAPLRATEMLAAAVASVAGPLVAEITHSFQRFVQHPRGLGSTRLCVSSVSCPPP